MGVSKPHIGELRNVGVFRNNTAKTLATAGYIDGYQEVITSVFCKIKQQNRYRKDEFGQLKLTATYVMVCRFCDAIDDILKPNTIFTLNGKDYTVAGIPTVIDERNFFYEFQLNAADV